MMANTRTWGLVYELSLTFNLCESSNQTTKDISFDKFNKSQKIFLNILFI